MSYTTCFKLSNILFCIFIRKIFWGIGAVFKNLKALFRKKLINLLIISCILLLALCFNSPTSCIQIVSAFQHFVTNNITKNHRRGVTKRSQRITTTRWGGGCKNVFVWLLKAIIVTLGKAQRFFITFLKFLKLWDIFLQVLSSVFVLDKCHFYQRSYWWKSFLSWFFFFLIVFCSCDLLFYFELKGYWVKKLIEILRLFYMLVPCLN